MTEKQKRGDKQSKLMHDPLAASFYSKIIDVMAGVEGIPKNGYNSYSNYRYVREADVTDHIRKLMVSAGLATTWEMASCERTQYLKGVMSRTLIRITMVDVDTGYSKTWDMIGESYDTTDKGIWKSIAGAFKYWMMKTFYVGGVDDPEENSDADTDAKQNNRAINTAMPETVDNSAAILEDRLFQESMKTIANATDYETLKTAWGIIRPLVVSGEKQKIYSKTRIEALGNLKIAREKELKKEGE